MGKIIKKFIKVMSFGGTILENYHSQEEPLSTMIERLSERVQAQEGRTFSTIALFLSGKERLVS